MPSVDPRGRPASLREQIVDAAVDVFSRLGADATRVEDLLQAAGIARRTFYKHFRSKEDVLTALYEGVTLELTAIMQTRRAESDDPIENIRATLDAYLAFHVDNHRIVKVLVEQGTRSESPLAPLRLRFREALILALAATFREATGRDVEPYVFVHLLSGLEGVSLELTSSETRAADVERARIALHGVLDAIVAGADRLPLRS